MTTNLMGVDQDRTSTEPEFTLGQLAWDHLGNAFVYVRASAAVAIYEACLISEDGRIVGVTTTTAAGGTGSGKRLCVPQIAIASASYGWGAVYGSGTQGGLKVLGAASCVKWTQLCTTATAGVLDDAATAAFILGAALEETLTGAAAAFVTLTFPHVNITI